MTQTQIDLRKIVPAERHSTVFKAFDSLAVGSSYVLVLDHNPRPLLRQFESQRKGAFQWEYLEEGPQQWQVSIKKVSDKIEGGETEEGCCGICGTD